MMKPRVLFRFDAGPDTGLGHLRRSLELAEEMRKQGIKEITILTATPRYTRPWVPKHFPLITLKARSIQGEVKKILRAFSTKPSLLILDHYGYGSAEVDSLQGAGMFVILFDDCGEKKNCKPAAVINHNIYGKDIRYPKVPGNRQYLGPAYTIINKAVREVRKARGASRQIIILFSAGGGADPKLMKIFTQTFAALKRTIPDVEAFSPRGVGSSRLISKTKGFHIVPASQMANCMAKATLAVSASGVTAYELACAGIPALLFSSVDNQDSVKATLCRLGAAEGLTFKNLSTPYLEKKILKLWADRKRRTKQIRTGMKLIDGRGAERLAKKLKKDFGL